MHRRRSLLAIAALLALFTLSCNGATQPDSHLGGHLIIAAGQAPAPGPIPVLLYTSDPFAKNASPIMIAPATGSGADLTFEFPTSVAHGDFYLVAWLDVGLDGQMDTGDYVGWYDGKTTAGAPVAAVVHKDNGKDRSVTIQVSIMP